MISLQNITKYYTEGGRDVHILESISLEIAAGEFIAIVGPSGSGKSSLLNILGLLDRPSGGSYRLAGQAVHSLSNGRRAKIRNQKIGFVFQSFMLLPRMTVMENVELPLLYSRCSRRERKARAKAALLEVGLLEKEKTRAWNLSGGEKQRVAIARSLVTHPEIILADEPTGNLDESSKADIMQIFQNLHEQGKTIILVTHDLDAASVAKRAYRISAGTMKEIAVPAATSYRELASSSQVGSTDASHVPTGNFTRGDSAES